MFEKILCPTDFSPAAKQALDVAARLAVEHHAELVIAHAWYVPAYAVPEDRPFPPGVMEEMIRDGERGLADAAREATALGATRVSTKFSNGVAWDQIVQIAGNDAKFDLVVLGTHGRTGVARLLLGSVAEKVVRLSPCSVMTVRASDARAFARVLCPVDFSDSAHRAMVLAGELVAPRGTVSLLHVVEPIAYATTADPGTMDSSTRTLEAWAGELRAKHDVNVTTRIELGSPAAQTIEILEAGAAFDLVVAGSHGRTGLRRLLLGSVAERIVRHAPCPVLIERTRAH